MPVQLTIRDVPEKVRDALAARAALQGKSMQEFLRNQLERIAARPSLESWSSALRARKKTVAKRVPPKAILAVRDTGRG